MIRMIDSDTVVLLLGCFPLAESLPNPVLLPFTSHGKKGRCRGKSDQAKQLLTLTQTHILIDIVHLTTMTNHGRACEVSDQPNVTCKINASLDANIYQWHAVVKRVQVARYGLLPNTQDLWNFTLHALDWFTQNCNEQPEPPSYMLQSLQTHQTMKTWRDQACERMKIW